MQHLRGGRRRPANLISFAVGARSAQVDEMADFRGTRKWRVDGRSRALLVVTVIWALGLIALAVVVEFQQRLDATRRAQEVTAKMLNPQGALLQIAFAPATTHAVDATQSRRPRRGLQGAKVC